MARDVLIHRVERYAREIVPAFNAYVYFRVGYWLAKKVAQHALPRPPRLHATTAALAAIDPSSTVVFVMNHRSNMDYVLVSFLAAERAALSLRGRRVGADLAAAGADPRDGRVLRAPQLRRPLYRRVLERYVQMATEAGVPQAVYPEGGLTRDGRLREPKLGVLDYMLRGFRPARRARPGVHAARASTTTACSRTARCCSTDRRRHAGRAKAAGDHAAFVARNVRPDAAQPWHRYGYACVNFGTPVSMRAYCRERGFDFRARREERHAAIAGLGAELMARSARVVRSCRCRWSRPSASRSRSPRCPSSS